MPKEPRPQRTIQNRINQRARRRRIRDAVGDTLPRPRAKPRQYHVDRWRLDEFHQPPVMASERQSASLVQPQLPRSAKLQLQPQTDLLDSCWFPLPADHLLHLIQYNVFRGLLQNKSMMHCLGYRFPSHSIVLSSSNGFTLPGSLAPTTAQMTIGHSSWIDIIPFPSIRNRLIMRELEFDHADFVRDLVGNLIDLRIFSSSTGGMSRKMSTNTDDVRGLIIWGEPYLEESWEATPAFLTKWAWAVTDCQELIFSSNRWRETRGEERLSTGV